MSFLDAIKAPFVSKPEPLSPNELSRLNQLRQTIREGLRSWVAAGEALREIRDRQLYRSSHPTFEVFAEFEFQLTGRRLTQLIDAAEQWGRIVDALPDAAKGPPPSERALRELQALPPGERVAAYADAIASEPTGPIGAPKPPSGKQVAEAVARRKQAAGKKSRPKPARFKVPGAVVTVEWNGKGTGDAAAALQAALDQLERPAAKAA
jgi:hypothetical protein